MEKINSFKRDLREAKCGLKNLKILKTNFWRKMASKNRIERKNKQTIFYNGLKRFKDTRS